MKRVALIAMLITGALMLQGCITAAIIGAGATATAKVATDPRTAGTQVDDATLNSRMGMKLKNNGPQFIGARIVSSTYGGDIILTGQANSEQIEKAESLAYEVEGVKKVYNQIRVSQPLVQGQSLMIHG